jgi:hypothetical protein
MTVIAGPPGSGRSALALALIRGALARRPDLAALLVSLTLSPNEQEVRLTAMESGIPARRIRSGLDASERQVCSEADARLSLDIRPRLRIIGAAGPVPASPDFLAGRPFEAATVLDYRDQLVRATGAKGCLIVVDDFASIGVPWDPVQPRTGNRRKDCDYHPERFRRLDWLTAMTKDDRWPAGGPLIVVAGVRMDGVFGWPYEIRGPRLIVENASTVAFLEPRTVSQRQGTRVDQRQGTKVERLILHVTKARYGRNADIPIDFDVGRYSFTETYERLNDKPRRGKRRYGS